VSFDHSGFFTHPHHHQSAWAASRRLLPEICPWRSAVKPARPSFHLALAACHPPAFCLKTNRIGSKKVRGPCQGKTNLISVSERREGRRGQNVVGLWFMNGCFWRHILPVASLCLSLFYPVPVVFFPRICTKYVCHKLAHTHTLSDMQVHTEKC